MTLRMVLALFEPRARRVLIALGVLFVLVALVQMVSVASILPFMSLAGDTQQIHDNRILDDLYDRLRFPSDESFLFAVGLIVLALTALSNGLNAVSRWALIRFGWHHQYEICVRLLSRYLSEPYEFFLSRNSADLTKTMFSEVGEVMNGVIVPGMQMVAKAIVVLSIFGLLLFVDPWLAIISTLVLGGAYGALYGYVRNEQARLGKVRVAAHRDRFRAAEEALAGIKESRVLGRERVFLDRFARPSKEFSRVASRNAIIVAIPKYALETIAFGGIILMTLYMLSTQEDYSQAVAVMSLYAVAGYRLMPALRDMFTGLAKLRFYHSAVESVYQHLRPDEDAGSDAAGLTDLIPDVSTSARLPFEREIRIDGLSFRYPNTDVDVLRDVDLTIPIRASIGLVGGTGSGKTTLVDLILGLLEPTEGRIWVDGVPLGPEIHRHWRRNLGYVPQEIFLCDDSIARNIAFGLSEERISREAVEEAARVAQIHHFITSLPQGYDTVVGERGVRLSGGQRQRIGIARALYHQPEVLILDEATSALDGITEDALMEAMQSLAGQKTMILIAHRVTTLRECNRILLFKEGRVAESGTYTELMEQSAEFRAMAKTAEVGTARV
jgi:ABC-type multidrug transport system fused ATPase/permease subunit